MEQMTKEAVKDTGVTGRGVLRSKNFFALGIMFWLYERSMDPTIKWIEKKFAGRPIVAEANLRALKAGYAFGETTEIFHTRNRVKPAKLPPGTYRNITGNEAAALGFVAATKLAKRELFKVPIERVEDPTLGQLFREQQVSLDRKLTMLGDRGRPEFLYGSLQVFGGVDEPLLDVEVIVPLALQVLLVGRAVGEVGRIVGDHGVVGATGTRRQAQQA